jgi:hypothetical protein
MSLLFQTIVQGLDCLLGTLGPLRYSRLTLTLEFSHLSPEQLDFLHEPGQWQHITNCLSPASANSGRNQPRSPHGKRTFAGAANSQKHAGMLACSSNHRKQSKQ